MILNTIYCRLSRKTVEHFKLIMAAAPLELHPERMMAPLLITGGDIDSEDLLSAPAFSATPVAFRTVYSAYTASTHLLLEMDSPSMTQYTMQMLEKYGGGQSMYSDTVDYPHLLIRVAPPFSRKQRGWIANMSTTLAQSSPTIEFNPPELETTSM